MPPVGSSSGIEIVRGKNLQKAFIKAPKFLDLAATSAMKQSVKLIEYEVFKRTPSGATGNLRGSLFSALRGFPTPWTLGVVAFGATYGRWVEFGRKPGKMPPWRPGTALAYWSLRKLGDERLAYPIARAIARRGTKEQKMMRGAWRANEQGVIRIWQKVAPHVAKHIAGRVV